MIPYKITLLEFAHTNAFPNAMLYSGYCDDFTGSRSMTYMIGVLQNEDDLIVIDTGYDLNHPEALEHMRKEQHIDYQSPVNVLRKINIDAADVRHVILTHAHWDHMGGISYFPNATFYLQKEELLQWIYTLSLPKEYGTLKSATKYSDIENCISLLKEGRLVLLDGDVDDLFPGIDIRVARNGHSFASNMILIQTQNGKYIYTGDTVFVRENLVGLDGSGISLPNGYSIGSMYDAIHTMQDILRFVDHHSDRIIINHDVNMWDYFQSIKGEDNLHIGFVG